MIGKISSIEIRPATRSDVAELWSIRYSVTENTLTPGRISDAELFAAIEEIGRGWLAYCDGRAAGFSIGLFDGQVWALFVRPEFQACGVGTALHSRLLTWFASQPVQRLWLTTGTQTRARLFYLAHGWHEVGQYGAEEVRMERENQF